MITRSDTMPDFPAETPEFTPAVLRPTRPFYWSVRRELWDNRSIYMVPLIAAGVVLFASLLGARRLAHGMRGLAHHFQGDEGEALAILFYIAAFVVIVTALIVGITYCLGALFTERRDRGILFWKSLPVSDLTTVLAKASIPFVVLPVVAFATIAVLHVAMMLLSSLVLLASGMPLSPLWTTIPWMKMYGTMAYGLPALTLWYAPVWGWLLLVSSWARRGPFLWAVLPPLALCVVEQIAFGTNAFGRLLGHRLFGGFAEAFTARSDGHDVYDPAIAAFRFLVSPDLWVGLGFGVAFIAGAVWLRRYREPI
jgi:ABC-2 type transport system permease protein